MRKFFIRGLIALLPIVVTILVLQFIITFLYEYVAKPIGDALRWTLQEVIGWVPEEHQFFNEWGIPFLGLSAAILITLAFGFIVATFLGKKLFQLFEWMIKKVPHCPFLPTSIEIGIS